MKHANYVGQKGTILKDYSKVSVDYFTNILFGKFTVYLVKETRVECNPKNPKSQYLTAHGYLSGCNSLLHTENWTKRRTAGEGTVLHDVVYC